MNKNDLLIVTLLIQVALQMFIYFTTRKMYHNLTKRIVLTLSLSHKLWDCTRQSAINGIQGVFLLGYNLLISVLVLKFTSSSTIAGLSNLGASVIVGLVMLFEFGKLGKFYIEAPKESKISTLLRKLKGE